MRHPIKEKGKVNLKICTDKGIKNIVVTKNNPLYKNARKVKVGDSLEQDTD